MLYKRIIVKRDTQKRDSEPGLRVGFILSTELHGKRRCYCISVDPIACPPFAQVVSCNPIVFEYSAQKTRSHITELLTVFNKDQLRYIALQEPAVVGRSVRLAAQDGGGGRGHCL